MKSHSKARQILLLSPYGGDNLGDGAIQETFLAGIRRREPEAAIVGLTLNPMMTEAMHGHECHTVSAISVPYYSPIAKSAQNESPAPEAVDEGPDADADGTQASLDMIKRIPLLGPALRFGKRVATAAIDVIVQSYREIVHTYRSLALCRKSSHVIVAGGGQLDDEWGGPLGHPYVLWKWSWLAKLTGARFCFAGVGYSELHHALSRYLVAGSLKRSAVSSFRDVRSQDRAVALYPARNAEVVPDIAFGRLPPDDERPWDEPQIDIGLSPIAYMSEYYWPQTNASLHTAYINALAEYIATVADEGRSIALFSTASADDRTIKLLTEAVRKLDAAAADSLEHCTPSTVDELLGFLARCRSIVASRLHGVILSHVMFRPVLAISYDDKVSIHMRDMEQAEYCLDIDRIDAAQLLERQRLIDARFDDVVDQVATQTRTRSRALDAHLDRLLQDG